MLAAVFIITKQLFLFLYSPYGFKHRQPSKSLLNDKHWITKFHPLINTESYISLNSLISPPQLTWCKMVYRSRNSSALSLAVPNKFGAGWLVINRLEKKKCLLITITIHKGRPKTNHGLYAFWKKCASEISLKSIDGILTEEIFFFLNCTQSVGYQMLLWYWKCVLWKTAHKNINLIYENKNSRWAQKLVL